MRVVLGAHRLQEPEESQQIFSVAESIAHPLYNPRAVDNDIRLLRVSLHRAPSGRAVGYGVREGGGVSHSSGVPEGGGVPHGPGVQEEMGCPMAPGHWEGAGVSAAPEHREGGWVPHGPRILGGGGMPHEGPSRH